MSLIHRHPAKLNPRVHYISPVFHPVEAQLAALERAAPRTVPEPVKPARARARPADDESRKRLRAETPMAVRLLCARLMLRLQCGHVLFLLWRGNGRTLPLGDLGYTPSSISSTISEVRRRLPTGCRIDNVPGVGWSIPEDAREPLSAIIGEHADA